jgi:DNA (cytosine-5)-methyltransferase 1
MKNFPPSFHITCKQELSPTGEQVVVHFAGGGGSCTGMEEALGYSPHHAVNHNEWALGLHRSNHPNTRHHVEDVFLVDPEEIKKDGPIGAAWFSPSCTDHSRAKTGKPVDRKLRALTLVMLPWAKAGTRVMYMENVTEILSWGPLKKEKRMVTSTKNGKRIRKECMLEVPDPAHRGRTWQAFIACMTTGIRPDHPDLPFILQTLKGTRVTKEDLVRGFGYAYESRSLRACEYEGTPTTRNRLYAVFRNDGRPIVWPAPTHADPDELQPGDSRQPVRTAAECINWSLPCPSIFLSPAEAKKIKCKRPLAKASLRRIARGVEKFMLNTNRPFMVSLTHVGGDRVEDLDEPMRTVTGAKRGEKALVRHSTASGFITEHANSSHQRCMSLDEPLRTQCAFPRGGHFALAAASLGREFGASVGQPLDQPHPSVMPHGQGKSRLLVGTLVTSGYGEREGQLPRIQDPGKPLSTIPGSGVKQAVLAASLVKMRGTNVGSTADEPLHVVSANGQHHALLSACMAQHNGGFNTTPARSMEEPLSPVTTTGSQQQMVAASLATYYGSDQGGQGLDKPMRTSRLRNHMGLVAAPTAFQMTEKEEQGAKRVARFLRQHGVQFDGPYALVQGLPIIDLGMRMLVPRELYTANGFPPTFEIEMATFVDEKGKPYKVRLTKTQQILLCGNAVCPPVAKALVRANSADMIRSKQSRWLDEQEIQKEVAGIAGGQAGTGRL